MGSRRPRTAHLRPLGVTKGASGGLAHLHYDRRAGDWAGSIRIPKGKLPPGSYAYVVLFRNVQTPNGVAPTVGDTICEFDVFDDPPTSAG